MTTPFSFCCNAPVEYKLLIECSDCRATSKDDLSRWPSWIIKKAEIERLKAENESYQLMYREVDQENSELDAELAALKAAVREYRNNWIKSRDNIASTAWIERDQSRDKMFALIQESES